LPIIAGKTAGGARIRTRREVRGEAELKAAKEVRDVEEEI
jgi:hypothetical protein